MTSHRFLADDRFVRAVLQGGTAYEFDAAAARAALGFDAPGPPVLISEEDLSGTLHIGLTSGYVAKATAERLHAVAPEAEIVIFVRAQPSAAVSWYVQYLRQGGTGSALRYLFPDTYRHVGWARPFLAPRFDFSQLDYRGLIETYDSLFGRERVHVYVYEELVRDRPAMLARMARELELTIDGDPLTDRPANDSYARVLLPLARAANLFTFREAPDKHALIHIPYWYAARKYLLAKSNRLPLGPRPRADRLLGRQALDWIAQRFWQSNRWLAERTGADLAALGYPLDPPLARVEPPAPPAWRRWMRN
ncbi:MAG: hypothetical protein ACTHM0_11855 [Sphingomonas sp.]